MNRPLQKKRKTAHPKASDNMGSDTSRFRHLYVWDRIVLQLAAGIKNRRHRHFGAFLLIAPDAPIEVVAEAADRTTQRIEGQAILVAPNVWHRLDARNSRVATLLVGPDHEWFGHVSSAISGRNALLLELPRLTSAGVDWDRLFSGQEQCETVQRFALTALATLSKTPFKPHTLDPRLANALRLLEGSRGVSIAPAALGKRVGLSGVTLMRKFKRELGVRIREYVLWRRLLNTLPLAKGRRTLTEIAQLAGFYDQAHLTRTARRMFDIQPSDALVMKRAKIHLCDRRTKG